VHNTKFSFWCYHRVPSVFLTCFQWRFASSQWVPNSSTVLSHMDCS
jgi:hypothetical protein